MILIYAEIFLLNYECLLCRIAILTSAHRKSSAFLQTILTTNIFGAILSRDCLLMMCVAHYTYPFFKLNLIAFRCKYSAGMFKSTLFFYTFTSMLQRHINGQHTKTRSPATDVSLYYSSKCKWNFILLEKVYRNYILCLYIYPQTFLDM